MEEVIRQLEQSPALREFLERKAFGCFLCRWILRDINEEKRLTGWPLDSFGKPEFPVIAKLHHLALELGKAPEKGKDPVLVVLDLLSKKN